MLNKKKMNENQIFPSLARILTAKRNNSADRKLDVIQGRRANCRANSKISKKPTPLERVQNVSCQVSK